MNSMDRTLDAKFLILSPNESDRKRLNTLVEMEYCEIYIIENYKLIAPLVKQMEKVILVIDYNSVQIQGDFNLFIGELIDESADQIMKVIAVNAPENSSHHEKILYCNSQYLESDDNVIKLIQELNVWGQRNYIRFGNSLSRIAFFRIKLKDHWRTGVIHDISASGMSCSFDKYSDLELNELDTEIQLCISERIFSLTGKFLVRRSFKTNNIFVIVFSRKKTHETIRSLNSIVYALTRETTLNKIRKIVP